ncbi:putative ABC transport system permease protein [Eubacterium uniforme]|uniref:Putative ABC transport system permease protein n=1 Tax=Eubacterium uniforme TaxID=39495 RepID=A0A1T4V895_9FIRM|nr:ABC transporter permease [Eubacterium uniforme]SKA61133.1 putative ABC transport system permease protein [Eubacterium uniforme]
MKALRKDFYMQIKKTLNRYLSIMAIVSLGVAFYAGVTSAEPDMRYTADHFYDENNMMDIRVVGKKGCTDDDINKLKEIDEIEDIAPSKTMDLIVELEDKEETLKAMSLEDDINLVTIKDGRLPKNKGECVIDKQLAEDKYKIGDVIKVKDKLLESDEMKIVGIFTSPLFTARDKGQTTVGNGKIKGLFVIKEDEFKTGYSEIYLTVKGAKDKMSASSSYDDLVDEVKEKVKDKLGKGYYVLDRKSIESYVEYDMDASRIGNIGKVFPIFFFIIAAMVCLTTMTRMVEENRTEIGTYKALGYGKFAIVYKYIIYAASATLIGGIIGAIVGSYIFPYIIIKAYGIQFANLEQLVLKLDPFYITISILIAVVSITMAALMSCINELRSTPASLMRPLAPKMGKKVLLERIPFIWNRLSFNMKSTIRNLFRYKKRLFMTLFGISGSCALMLVGYGINDAVKGIVYKQFGDISNYDMTVNINVEALRMQPLYMLSSDSTKPLTENPDNKNMLDDFAKEKISEIMSRLDADDRIDEYMEVFQSSSTIRRRKKDYSANIFIPKDTDKLGKYIDLRNRKTKKKIEISDDGILIDEKLASLINAKVGSNIAVKDANGKKAKCKVKGIFENYTNHYIYMSQKYYENNFDTDIIFNAAITKNKEGYKEYNDKLSEDLLAIEGVALVSFLSTTEDTVLDMFASMNGIIMVLIVCAGILAFIVLYNLNNVNIEERKRELATLKVLGFYDGEVSGYIYRENIIITFMGIVLGFIFGRILLTFVVKTAEVDAMMFAREVKMLSYAYSAIFTVLFAVIINYVMHIRLKSVDMATSLKSVE